MAGYIAGIGGANVDIHGQSDAPIVMRDSNPGRLHLSAACAATSATTCAVWA